MNTQSLTITLPTPVYHHFARQAQGGPGSIAEEVVAIVTNYLQKDRLTNTLSQELEQLNWLTDSELWQAARMTVPKEQPETMQVLVEKQQREGLTEKEEQQAQSLSRFFNRVMLIRAKAAMLLKRRGYDISTLIEQNE